MSEQNQTVVTLTAKEGKNGGDCVGTYERFHIVFLPKSVMPDQQVRVRLFEVRNDSRGRMMYRGEPAPVEFKDTWRDNGDGTISLVRTGIDWLLAETGSSVIETRPKAKRDGRPTEASTFSVVWGIDATSSILEEGIVRTTPEEMEAANGGSQPYWTKSSERQENLPVIQHPVVKVTCDMGFGWEQAVWAPEMQLAITVCYIKQASSWNPSQTLRIAWGDFPAWLQAEQEAKYPLCSCGRSRFDRDDLVWKDGYGKCQKCRLEQPCDRCGKTQTNWSGRSDSRFPRHIGGGKMVCQNCWPMHEQEQLIHAHVPPEKRQELADMAKLLLAVEPVPQEAGELILEATKFPFTSHDYRWMVEGWKGYAWYYFTEQGVFGTKFSKEALTVLSYLPQASGNSLVEFIAWLAGSRKFDPHGQAKDFYYQTQILGQEGLHPAVEERLLESLAVATRLRGPEAERALAAEGYVRLREALDWFNPMLGAVEQILQAKEQDYAAALAEIAKVEAVLSARQAVEAAIAEHFAVCPLCGEPMGPNGCRKGRDHWTEGVYPSDTVQWDVWEGGDTRNTVLAQICTDQGQIVAELVLSAAEYRSSPDFGDVFVRRPDSSSDGAWDGRTPFQSLHYKDLDKVLTAIDPKLRRQLEEAKAAEEAACIEYAYLQNDMENAGKGHAQAETDFVARSSEFGTDQIKEGTVFSVSFQNGTGRNEGELVTEPFFDVPSGRWIKLVADPYSAKTSLITVGQEVLVAVRPKNDQQVHLFRYRDSNPEGANGRGGRVVEVFGYFAVLVPSPKDFEQALAKAEAVHQVAIAKHKQLQDEFDRAKQAAKKPTKKPKAVFSDSSTVEEETSMAAALQKALGGKRTW